MVGYCFHVPEIPLIFFDFSEKTKSHHVRKNFNTRFRSNYNDRLVVYTDLSTKYFGVVISSGCTVAEKRTVNYTVSSTQYYW